MNAKSSKVLIGLFVSILLTSTLSTSLLNTNFGIKNPNSSLGHPIVQMTDAFESNQILKYNHNEISDDSYQKQEEYKKNDNDDYSKPDEDLKTYDSKTHKVTLEIEQLNNGQYAYKMKEHIVNDEKNEQDLTERYSSIATIPGPSIEINEGDKLILKSITGDNKVKEQIIEPKYSGSFEYSGENNTRNLGLFGAIIVHPTGGTESIIDGKIQQVKTEDIKKQFVLFMVGSTFWGMEIDENHIQTPLWTNPTLGTDLDDLVQFHILGAGHKHTFHLHAHRWLDPGTSDVIDVKPISPGKPHDFIIKAGESVGPGNWQYHCHVFAHMEAGMMGSFNVGEKGSNTQSIPGASPYDQGSQSTITNVNFVTFRVTDDPGTWFNNVANLDSILPSLGGSLGIINPGGTVHFVMTDTNSIHTVTSLLWPKDAKNMPFDQITGYEGGAIVTLEDPGLYVMTCKVHPYMFAGVLVDDPLTTTNDNNDAYDIGEELQLANGVVLKTDPTLNDPTFNIFTSLVQTFFKVTNTQNWKDYRQPTHGTELPPVNVILGGNNIVNLGDLSTSSNVEQLKNPTVPGIGEVWVNTQFEITDEKSKPGTATKVNTADWQVERKVSLPEINMNHPHNMWTDIDQKIIYQTMWFDNRVAVFERETGNLINSFAVGDAPSHVITNPLTDLAYIALNGEQGVAEIKLSKYGLDLLRVIPMQKSGQDPTHPHGHWISSDGSKMVTPNALTADSTVYDFFNDQIKRTIDENGNEASTGAIPIATGIRPQGDKYYVANLLDSTISVIDLNSGKLLKNINLLSSLFDNDPNNDGTTHALPIQTPVSPDGKFMVTANTLTGSISVVNTDPNSPTEDEVVASLPCDPGCHGVNFGFKDLNSIENSENIYPYYAYVTSKFSNALIVIDPDPNNDGDGSDAKEVGRILLTEDDNPSLSPIYESDDDVIGLDGTGGQGVLAIPNPYPGWVFKLPQMYKDMLTENQLYPVSSAKTIDEKY